MFRGPGHINRLLVYVDVSWPGPPDGLTQMGLAQMGVAQMGRRNGADLPNLAHGSNLPAMVLQVVPESLLQRILFLVVFLIRLICLSLTCLMTYKLVRYILYACVMYFICFSQMSLRYQCSCVPASRGRGDRAAPGRQAGPGRAAARPRKAGG